jgi:hypothetical protein
VKIRREFFTLRNFESPASSGFPRSGRSTRVIIQLRKILMTKAILRRTITQGDIAMHQIFKTRRFVQRMQWSGLTPFSLGIFIS